MGSLVEDFYESIKGLVPPESVGVILDLGSRDAEESLALSRLYPRAQVFAFECHPRSIERCRANTRGEERIEVVPLAVHNTNGLVEFYPIDLDYNGNIGASSLLKASGHYDSVERYPQKCIQVQATRLDSWARRRGINRVDLVWMDLQGGELLALNGMGSLLATVRALHTEVEYQEIYSGQVLFPAIDRYMTEGGFLLLRNREEVRGWYGDAIYVRKALLRNEKVTGSEARAHLQLREPRRDQTPRNVVVVFDDLIRPDTTGTHCLRALNELVRARHVLPDQELPRSGVDLYLQIDDGSSGGMLAAVHPSAFWAIDTHLAYERLLKIAREVDFVFCAQLPAVERMRNDGIERVTWLPLACDPEYHRSFHLDEVYDVAFIGNLVTEERRRILSYLKEQFPRSFVGRAFGEDWQRISSQARVLFNKSILGDINMRVFESMATGKPLVTDALPAASGLEKLFKAGHHLLTFEIQGDHGTGGDYTLRSEGFTTRIRELLHDSELRERIGSRGKALVVPGMKNW
jgi:FkbM family methyltransferase